MPCKSALNRVSGMPFRWSLNPYRGCVHGCHYCYARATHPYLGMNADEDFATKIIVKTNMPEVLRQELGKPSWTRERVAIGTATDAYQPCEGRYRLTRRCLEALRDADTPVSIVTKSTLILRDLDLLDRSGPGTRSDRLFHDHHAGHATVAADRAGHASATQAPRGLAAPERSRHPVRGLPGADPARHHRFGGIDRGGGRGGEGAWRGLVRLRGAAAGTSGQGALPRLRRGDASRTCCRATSGPMPGRTSRRTTRRRSSGASPGFGSGVGLSRTPCSDSLVPRVRLYLSGRVFPPGVEQLPLVLHEQVVAVT